MLAPVSVRVPAPDLVSATEPPDPQLFLITPSKVLEEVLLIVKVDVVEGDELRIVLLLEPERELKVWLMPLRSKVPVPSITTETALFI